MQSSRYFPDTIFAIVTAAENAPVGIVRLSGPSSLAVLKSLFRTASGAKRDVFKGRYFYYGSLVDGSGELIDRCLAVFMPGPGTFTGEDVVELQCHGNMQLLKLVLKAILGLGIDSVRPAEAGEFSKRAFLNGRIDLAQAEAIQEIIGASSEEALRTSLMNLDGRLSAIVEGFRQELLSATALVEASFEFPEEDIATFQLADVKALLLAMQVKLSELMRSYQNSRLYDFGVQVAIAGRPNVGKSSLLNALLVEERAIVSEIAGTTRDVVEGSKTISGLKFYFKDTAGLRDTDEFIEGVGIQRARDVMAKADIILCVVDELGLDEASLPILQQFPDKCLLVVNKVDLMLSQALSVDTLRAFVGGVLPGHQNRIFAVSAMLGTGIVDLESGLIDFCGLQKSAHNSVHINVRQLELLSSTHVQVTKLIQQISDTRVLPEELLAEELRAIASQLQRVTGEVGSDAVLGEIFDRFCIGK